MTIKVAFRLIEHRTGLIHLRLDLLHIEPREQIARLHHRARRGGVVEHATADLRLDQSPLFGTHRAHDFLGGDVALEGSQFDFHRRRGKQRRC